MEALTVKEIVEAYLKANNFDGLFADGLCSCEVGDLAPCGEMQAGMIHKMRELNEKQTS